MMRIFLNKKELQTTINIWFHQVNAHLVKKRTIWHDIQKLDYCNWLYSTESKLIFPRFLAIISWSVSSNLLLINLILSLNLLKTGNKNAQLVVQRCCKNEFHSDVARFTALVQAFLATNQVVERVREYWRDFWLNKIVRDSRQTGTAKQVSLGPVKRITCTGFLQYVELRSNFCNNFSHLAATWFVARQAWFSGGKTCNIAFQLAQQQCCKTSCTFLFSVLPYLKF